MLHDLCLLQIHQLTTRVRESEREGERASKKGPCTLFCGNSYISHIIFCFFPASLSPILLCPFSHPVPTPFPLATNINFNKFDAHRPNYESKTMSPKGFASVWFGLVHFKHLIINARRTTPFTPFNRGSRWRVRATDERAGQGRAGEGAIFYPQSASSIALSCSQVVVQGVDVVLKN